MGEILVMGGGIAGMQASLDLAAMDHRVFLVEKSNALGGNLLRLDRVFPTNEKADTIVENYVKMIETETRIMVFKETHLQRVEGKIPTFKITVEGNGSKKNLTVASIIIATGFTPYDVALKREYGCGKFDNVISAIDLENMLRQKNLQKRSDSKTPNSIVFVQCVGFRDMRAKEYCSSFCCKNTLKNAILLKKEHPNMQTVVMYMDIRTPSLSEQMYAEARELGVRFIRSRPAEVFEKNGKLAIGFENTLTGKVGSIESDMIVLSVGAVPAEETRDLARMMKLTICETGFFKITSPPSGTGIPGIFLAGSNCGPKDINYSTAEAAAAAVQVNIGLRKVNGKD